MAVGGTSAFYVSARSDIAAGDEITVDYGRSYFDDGICPCHTCAQSSAADKPTTAEKEADLRNESNDLKRKKSEKRFKRKQRTRLRVAESVDREKRSKSE